MRQVRRNPHATLLPARHEPRHPFSYSDMHMKVPVVLFIAEGGQNLATTMLIDDVAGDLLHDLQQVSTHSWLQLQQRPNMALRDHDHVISPEP